MKVIHPAATMITPGTVRRIIGPQECKASLVKPPQQVRLAELMKQAWRKRGTGNKGLGIKFAKAASVRPQWKWKMKR